MPLTNTASSKLAALSLKPSGHRGSVPLCPWNGSEFTLLVKEKIKANDLKKIKAVIDENADLIIKRWEEHFNS